MEQLTEDQEKSLKVLYVVCNTDPTPTDLLGFRMSVLGITEFIQNAVKEADASGNYWASFNAIERYGKYYFDEDCTEELKLTF